LRKISYCLLFAMLWLVAVSPINARADKGPRSAPSDMESQKQMQKETIKRQKKAEKKQAKRIRKQQKKAARDYKKKHPSAS
jgi:hypothetical protein